MTYKVVRGDTLYSIAKKYNVTVNELINANNLKTTSLQIGQTLTIPTKTNTGGNITYIVKRGDTLYGISNQFGVSSIDIATLNNVNANNIYVGQELIIPTTAGTNPDNLFIYTVKKGDSLYSIARLYETTVDEIIKLNSLTNTNLSIGQTLRIPESGKQVTTLPTYINYTVQKGDSLYSIARKYGRTVEEIMQDNGLQSTVLQPGDTLQIRTTEETVVEECFGEEYTPPTKDITYTVKKGDSLYKIAQNFNTSVDNIKSKNNLKSNNLQIGQVLLI